VNHRIVSSSLRAGALALVVSFATLTALAGGGAPAAATVAEIVSSRTSSMGPMRLPGIKLGNFGVVNGRIFRGAQPGSKDYAALSAVGITTIIDLREDAKSSARRDAEAAGLRYINIAIKGHGTPTDAQAAAFIAAVNDPANGVVYTHCAGGRHRTGSMIAAYRMSEDGWSLEQAYSEMLAYDFYTRNGHGGFKTFVEEYAGRVGRR
jgi:tyrosine-protein phosphatase SIW14